MGVHDEEEDEEDEGGEEEEVEEENEEGNVDEGDEEVLEGEGNGSERGGGGGLGCVEGGDGEDNGAGGEEGEGEKGDNVDELVGDEEAHSRGSGRQVLIRRGGHRGVGYIVEEVASNDVVRSRMPRERGKTRVSIKRKKVLGEERGMLMDFFIIWKLPSFCKSSRECSII